MTNQEDKYAAETNCYEPLGDFDAAPMVGPGRWATFDDGTVLYTNDANILFAEGSTETGYKMRKDALFSFQTGKTATETFDRLRGYTPAVTGDLSELE